MTTNKGNKGAGVMTDLEQRVHAQLVPCLTQDWIYWLHDEVYSGNLMPVDMKEAIEQKIKEIAYKASNNKKDPDRENKSRITKE